MTRIPRHLCSRLEDVRHLFARQFGEAGNAAGAQMPSGLPELLNELVPIAPQEAAETLRSLLAFEHALGHRVLSEQDATQMHLLLGNLFRLLCPEEHAAADEELSELVPTIAPSVQNPHQSVAIYVESPAIASVITYALSAAGFHPYAISSMARILEAGSGQSDDRQPAAIVADLSLCKRDPDTRSVIRQLREEVVPAPHLFCLAFNDDFSARLDAVRLGATRFLKKPLDTEKLLAVLRGVTDREHAEPYRVMLVDDDLATILVNSTALVEIGMEVRTVTDPVQALAVAEAFRPDVVVMDVYMPRCNGMELAAVLRQDEEMTDTPILFLSAECSIHRQMVAMGLGADDFLTKPVEPGVLQASVIARAKRARMLKRTRMEHRVLTRKLDGLMLAQAHAVKPWRLDATRRVLVAPNGVTTSVSAMESAVLQTIAAHPEHHATREQLMTTLTGMPGTQDGSRLEALISRLRRKTLNNCSLKLPIRSEYGRGYSFGGRLVVS